MNLRRLIRVTLIGLMALLLAGCDRVFEVAYCDWGYSKAGDDNFEGSIQLLDKCLALDSLTAEKRAFYLQVRARSLYRIGEHQRALDDLEAAFAIVPPTTHREFIVHAAYLRRLGRYQESLTPLFQAEVVDELNGHTSMMTQYNLGWTLYELGRYEEAIAAFTRGIPHQPDYPFVYYRRGLAYHKSDNVAAAAADFEKFVALYDAEAMRFPGGFMADLRVVAAQHPVLQPVLEDATKDNGEN